MTEEPYHNDAIKSHEQDKTTIPFDIYIYIYTYGTHVIGLQQTSGKLVQL